MYVFCSIRKVSNFATLMAKNYIKYCIKSRSLPVKNWKHYTMPAVAVLANEVYYELENDPGTAVEKSKLYQHWLIFN